MTIRKLIATKTHRYSTRRLVAGDEFTANDMHARILVGLGKARYAPDEPVAVADPSTSTQAKPEAMIEEPAAAEAAIEAKAYATAPNNIDALRAQAEALGIDVDGRWGVARLQHEIAQAQR